MLAYLVLAVVASASAIPLGEKKILPIWEDSSILTHADAKTALRSWCIDDCHHHVLNKPVFLMMKSTDSKMDVSYFPLGLNSLGKTPLTTPIKEYLMTGNKVAMITPLAKFPFELFPGLLDTDIITPEHVDKFNSFYKEAPVMVILNEEDFKMFSEKKGYTHLADMAIDDMGFSIYKDLAQFRSIYSPMAKQETAPGLYYLVPSTHQGVVPSTAGLVPLTSSEYIRYLSGSTPVVTPNQPKTFFF